MQDGSPRILVWTGSVSKLRLKARFRLTRNVDVPG